MNKITLNRMEIDNLIKIAQKYSSDEYTLIAYAASGVGIAIEVLLKVEEDPELTLDKSIKFDITDYTSW